MNYLALCWQRHYGAVVSPTIIWNLVINNLAFEVNKNPETYKKYFTKYDNKEEIMVIQDGFIIDSTLLIDEVTKVIPPEIMKHIFPTLSTNTEQSTIANNTAFLDMVSPYYSFSMYMCGIPKVCVEGTDDDWNLLVDKCTKIMTLVPEFESYLSQVARRIVTIVNETCNYADIFELIECGSGSHVEVGGWIKDFYIEKPQVEYVDNFVPCVSKIKYHCYTNNKDYYMYAGLFLSEEYEGYLIPSFQNIYFEINSVTKVTSSKDSDKISFNYKKIYLKTKRRKND